MSVTTRVFKNSSLLLVANVVTNLMMFLLTLFTARYLGTSNFGILSSAISLVSVFGVFCDLGLGMYSVQRVSRDHSLTGKYFGTAFALRFILSIITLFAFIVFVFYSNFTGDTFYVMIMLGMYMLFNSLATFYYSLFQSNEQMQYQTIVSSVYSVGIFLIALVFIYLGVNVVFIASAYPLAMGLAFIVGTVFKFKYYPRYEFDFSGSFIKELVVNGIPFGITSFFTSIYFWIASIILTFMSGSVAVGLFSSSQKLILVLASIFGIVSNAIFPIMSQLFVDDKGKLNALYHKLLKFMLILGVPIAVGTAIYSRDIILIIFSSQFVDATLCLSVLIWATIFMFLSGTLSILLGAINKQWLVTKVTLIGAVVSVIINILLIPSFSYIGASITSVITEFVVLVLMIYSLRNTEFSLNIRKAVLPVIQVIISNIVMAVVLLYLQLPFMLGVIVAVLVYLVAIFVTGAINKEDREIILGLFNQFRNRG